MGSDVTSEIVGGTQPKQEQVPDGWDCDPSLTSFSGPPTTSVSQRVVMDKPQVGEASGRPRAGGHLRIPCWVFDNHADSIGMDGWCVLSALVRHADNQSGCCYPSYRRMAKLIGASRNTVINAVKKVEKAGLIRITKRWKEGLQKTNRYQLLFHPSAQGHGAADGPLVSQAGRPVVHQAGQVSAPAGPELTSFNYNHINTFKTNTKYSSESVKTEDIRNCLEQASTLIDPVVLIFPCSGMGLKEWLLRESKLTEYRASFPGVDIISECRKALQWLRDNPTRRKTHQGVAAFLNRWLTRAQNGGTNDQVIHHLGERALEDPLERVRRLSGRKA